MLQCVFHCCLEWQTMLKKVLDPQATVYVVVEPSKTMCADFS